VVTEQASDSPAVTAKAEAARQLVILAFGIAGVLIMVWAQRASSDPDFYRAARMRAAKVSERLAARVAARSWGLAERARRSYESDAA
jgi:hypothetical protein